MIHENLIFLIAAPRSGSTLLQRMLASHPEIYSHPEPHLITPLAHLGYYNTVEKAPYDHINAAQAMREFCQELPHGEQDYLDALRAYASTLYERVLAKTGKMYFLDKTPAYALVLPFLTKLYPRARYVVLTRHPLAILHSQAHSFFGGDYQAAVDTNPIIAPYVRAIGAFLIDRPVPCVQVRYDDVVREPEAEMRRICEHLGVGFVPEMVEYGRQQHISKSYGDPLSVEKHTRPVTNSLETWAADLSARPAALALVRQLVTALDAAHLSAWGYPKAELLAPLDGRGGALTRQGGFSSYRFKRQILLRLRKNIHHNALGAAVKKVRYYCDVLLRE